MATATKMFTEPTVGSLGSFPWQGHGRTERKKRTRQKVKFRPGAHIEKSAAVEIYSNCSVFYNEFNFSSHGCSINAPSHRPHCQIKNLHINRAKVQSDSVGGEPLMSMINFKGDSNLKYEYGAFSSNSLEDRAETNDMFHYLSDVFGNLKETSWLSSCDSTWEGTTLFIRRYEYVNLFHTMTDWWNLFFSLPSTTEPTNVVFLDAHAEGGLDPVWKKLVRGGNVTHLQKLGAKSSVLCFEDAKFVPPGYASPLYHRRRPQEYTKCSSSVMMDKFVGHFLDVYELTDVKRIPGLIVVLDRMPFKDYPQRDMTKLDRVLPDLRPLAMKLPKRIQSDVNVNVSVQVETMSNLTMQEQIRIVRRADVLLGNHGAGLTHGLFLDNGALMIEMSCAHGFFPEIMKWKPKVTHHCGDSVIRFISDSYWDRVVQKVTDHMRQT